MQTLICPSCGLEKNKNNFVGNICKDCFYKHNAKFEIKLKDIIICKSCGRLKQEFNWIKFSEDSLEDLIVSNIKSNLDYKIKDVDFVFLQHKIEVCIDFTVNKDSFSKCFTFTPKYQYCQDCYKKSSDFFEAIVQLRGFGNDKNTKNTFLRILNKAEKAELKKGNFNAFLQKQEIVNNGIDLYLGSKTLAKSFIKELYKDYIFDKKESYKLVGILPGGKKKIRTTFLIRKHEEKQKEEQILQK